MNMVVSLVFLSSHEVEAVVMVVGDGDGEPIGRIIGARRLVEVEQMADHKLHLRLVGVAIARDRVFDFGRRVFAKWDARLGEAQQQDTTCLPNGDRGGGVSAEKQLLNPRRIGLILRQQRTQFGVDLEQPIRHFVVGNRLNNAPCHNRHLAIMHVDNAVASRCSPRVKAKNSQNESLSISC